jgi:hypothetical protein
LIIFAVSIGENKKEPKKDDEPSYQKHVYNKTDYLGGHPIETEGMKLGVLNIIENKKIEFTTYNSISLFKINIKEITNCKLETKESLSAKRIALVGLLAFGLKKGRSYVRISFNHKLGPQEVVFHNHNKENQDIVKKINTARLSILESNDSKNKKLNKHPNEDFNVSSIANEARKRLNKEIDNL